MCLWDKWRRKMYRSIGGVKLHETYLKPLIIGK